MNQLGGRLAVLVLAFAAADVAHAQVVISQVYGGGGNSGATYRNDFIELRNNGASAVSLSGWSLQYTSSAGATWTARTDLGGSIAPGGYYLVQQAAGTGGTTSLPAPDATGTIAMSGTAGKVALVSSTTALAGACPLGGAVVDFVGYGSAANCFEGGGATSTLSNATAALRNGDGSVDSNNNNADFIAGAPTPRNGGSPPPPPPAPPVALTIAQIQGSALGSAHDGERVVTEGIVTAGKFNNGFFLQSATGDGDPATSEAVFVFTGSAPPASAAVGNRVRVTGTVDEFTPSSNPNQLAITEIVSPTVELLESGLPLPAAVELTAAELGSGATPATLERLEGMRVSVANASVVAPSEGSIDENDALSASDGVFYVTLPAVAVPFREPGIGILDAFPVPAGKNPPRFDTNPERLMVRSRGQVGALPLTVNRQAQVAGLLGVLDYFSGTWALLPDAATPPTVSGGLVAKAVADAGYEDVTIGSFNLLRFFDEVNDSNGAVTLTAAAVDKRLIKTAAAICDYLKAPDILGVVEVEHLRVLGLLADRINSSCARAPAYVPYLVEGNDVGSIDVGFLVASRDNGRGTPRVQVLEVVQYGKDTTIANPDGSTSLLNDRPPLLLRALVRQDNGASYPVTVIANHLRSLNGIDDVASGSSGWSTGGARVRAKRGAQAAYLASLVEQRQQADPAEKIVLVGDFNAFEFNDGYVDVFGVIKGEEAAADQVIDYVASPLTTPLIDGSQLIVDPAQRYSYSFAGNLQTLDHVLVNEALLLESTLLRVEHARINADFATADFGDAAKPTRTSDHDPVRLAIAVPAFRSADLAVTASATPGSVTAGDTVAVNATVTNAGPNAAAFAAVSLVFDALLSPSVTNAAAGWTCAPLVQDATTTTVTCTTPVLAAGAGAAFALDVTAPGRPGGRPLRVAVATQSQTTDPANGNNQVEVEVGVAMAPSADLSVQLQGNVVRLGNGTRAKFRVPVANAGPDLAEGAILVIQGNAQAGSATMAPPAGWSCGGAVNSATGFRLQCLRGPAMAVGTQNFMASIVMPVLPAGGVPVTVTASISAGTADPSTGNNSVSYTQPSGG